MQTYAAIRRGWQDRHSAQHLLADIGVTVSIGLVIAVVMSFTGWWPTDDNPFCSYTLQACAWLDGRLDVGSNYTWLELAVYDGKYYVSFPPFPSYVLLPFCAVLGQDVPDHCLALAATLLSALYAMKLYRTMRADTQHAEWLVLFLLLGNGYLSIGIQAWVWHLAQAMCFALSMMALYYAARGKGGASLSCWAARWAAARWSSSICRCW